jgi:hypothetical protein
MGISRVAGGATVGLMCFALRLLNGRDLHTDRVWKRALGSVRRRLSILLGIRRRGAEVRRWATCVMRRALGGVAVAVAICVALLVGIGVGRESQLHVHLSRHDPPRVSAEGVKAKELEKRVRALEQALARVAPEVLSPPATSAATSSTPSVPPEKSPREVAAVFAGDQSAPSASAPSVSQRSSCPSDCLFPVKKEGPFKLVAFIHVRLYKKDKQKWTSVELVQWIQYMRWAGVEKLYLHDNYSDPEERQLALLQPLIDEGFLVYTDWSHKHPFDLDGTQMAAYRDAHAQLGQGAEWLLHFDMDEYPVDASGNATRNFLWQTFDAIRAERPRTGAILATNMVWVGQFDYSRELVIDRLHTRLDVKLNHLTKPVYYVPAIAGLGMHTPSVRGGFEITESPLFFMAHIWGLRLGDFSPTLPPQWRNRVQNTTELDKMRDNLLACSTLCSRKEFFWVTEPFWDTRNRVSHSPLWK